MKKQTKKIVNVGLIGLGTVGVGVAKILTKKHKSIQDKTGLDFRVVAACVKNPKKKRDVSLKGVKLTTDPKVILNNPDIHQVVEMIGGIQPAKSIIQRALEKNKDVISANKALFAEKGSDIYSRSQNSDGSIGIEAAVGGGIPVIQGLRDGLAANNISKIYGILNGTCNYILTRMTKTHLSYKDSLAEAQSLGYAEQDPKMDVDGTDTAHKLAILSRIAFQREIPFKDIKCEGIENIAPEDIEYAQDLGYAIKLLAIAKKDKNDFLELRVHPVLLSKKHSLAHVNDVYNAVLIAGDETDDVLFYGKGAGQRPTASAVVSDMISIAQKTNASLNFDSNFPKAKIKSMQETRSRYYLRFQVPDKPGVMGALTKILGQNKISLSSVHQKEAFKHPVSVVILTHEAKEFYIQKAIDRIVKEINIKVKPVMIRIEGEGGFK